MAAESTSINCVICFDESMAECEATLDCCSHTFHEPCIIRWVATSNTCPLCKRIISLITSGASEVYIRLLVFIKLIDS
jgi:hypothetical protein